MAIVVLMAIGELCICIFTMQTIVTRQSVKKNEMKDTPGTLIHKYRIAGNILEVLIWRFGLKATVKKYWQNLNLAVASQVRLSRSTVVSCLRYLNKAMSLKI